MSEYLYFFISIFSHILLFVSCLVVLTQGLICPQGSLLALLWRDLGWAKCKASALVSVPSLQPLLSILNKLNFTMPFQQPWGFACCGFWLILNRELEKRCDSSSSWETMSLCSGMGVSLCGSQQRKKFLQGRVGLKTLREPCRNHCQVFLWKCGGETVGSRGLGDNQVCRGWVWGVSWERQALLRGPTKSSSVFGKHGFSGMKHSAFLKPSHLFLQLHTPYSLIFC